MNPGDLRRLAVRLETFADFTRDPDRARQLAVDARLRAMKREVGEPPWELINPFGPRVTQVLADMMETAA